MHKTLWLAGFLILFFLFGFNALATTTIRDELGREISVTTRSEADYVDHQLIVFVKPDADVSGFCPKDVVGSEGRCFESDFTNRVAELGVVCIEELFRSQPEDEAQIYVFRFEKTVDITLAKDSLYDFEEVLLVEYDLLFEIGGGDILDPPGSRLDPLWSIQWNLKDGSLGIGCETAWEYTTGDSNVVIGFFEKGIKTDHDDFEDVFTDGFQHIVDETTPSGYRIVPGVVSSNDTHGTSVAGIVGARCNNEYIRGITGGDDSSRGCSLYSASFRLGGIGPNGIPVSELVKALDYAADDCDVINFSSSFTYYSEALRVGVWKVFQEGVSLVASKGESTTTGPTDDWAFPADYDFSKVVCVSGYSIDDTTLCDDNCGSYSTYYGRGLDFLAPADTFRTLTSDGAAGLFHANSGAVPHVSGAIGLLRSYLGNSLNPEDYEWLLKLTANDYNPDTDDDCQTWEEVNGHGNISLEQAFDFVGRDDFQIDEYTVTGASFVDSLYGSPVSYTLSKGTFVGDYTVMPCSLSATITYSNSYDGDIAAWGMCNDVTGVSAANPNFLAPYCKVESFGSTSCVVSTYLLRVHHLGISSWYPTSPDSVVLKCKVAGVHSRGVPDKAVGGDENVENQGIKVFDLEGHMRFSMCVQSGHPSLAIYDVRGRLIYETGLIVDGRGNVQHAWHGVDSKGRNVPSGVYFAVVRDDGNVLRRKITFIR